MSFGHDLIEVLGLSRGESSKAEVITDKEIRPEESFNPFFPGIICPGSIEAPEHLHRLNKEYIMAPAADFMPEGLCQVGLTHACWSVYENMLFFLYAKLRDVLD
jgi:hypothetical protein